MTDQTPITETLTCLVCANITYTTDAGIAVLSKYLPN